MTNKRVQQIFTTTHQRSTVVSCSYQFSEAAIDIQNAEDIAGRHKITVIIE
jgi:hypothetical protein